MYIQITTKCNMTCSHCCFDCTAQGSNMSHATFSRALAIAKREELPIVIGGGEPTLHPLLSQFIMEAVWELSRVSYDNGFPAIHIITNGSMKDTSISLANLAQAGVISARLSLDDFHESNLQDGEVIKAFQRSNDGGDCRGINRVTNLIKAGRVGDSECACSEIFVTTRGNVYPCSCKKDKIGNVFDENLPINSGYMSGYCAVFNKKELQKELKEYA